MTGHQQRIRIYDTTLRDGCQARGIALSVEDKLKIAVRLDSLAFSYIEGGWPGQGSPKDSEFFTRAKQIQFGTSRLVAFGSTRRPGSSAEKDAVLEQLLAAETPAVAIFGKSWDLHVRKVLGVSLDENLRMIEDSVRRLREAGREVIYDAEHFFDGYRHNPRYALKAIQTAQEAGADWIVLCETNGGHLPHQAEAALEAAREVLRIPWGIHAHNDSGVAVAVTLLAVQHGATQVQGTINGIGERCGNANLCTVIPNLEVKMGFGCIGRDNLTELTALSRYVSEVANIAHDERQPYVGLCAFAHKAGTHIDGVAKETVSFEHIDPALVGNERQILVSDQAGSRAVVEMLKQEFPALKKGDPRVRNILREVKEREKDGYQYEVADGSFGLLARKHLFRYHRLFDLEGFRVTVDRRENEQPRCEATIKVRVGGEEFHTAAEGSGPVNALDNALRKALEQFYPQIRDLALTDYKVRVLNEKVGTSARVRVLIESADHRGAWGTVGVSSNIIEASWQALVDSIEYGLHRALSEEQRTAQSRSRKRKRG